MSDLEKKVDALMVDVATIKGRLNGMLAVAGLAVAIYFGKGC